MALVAGRRNLLLAKAMHLTTINSLHAQCKQNCCSRWRGPVTKHLGGYTRWMVACRIAELSAMLRAILGRAAFRQSDLLTLRSLAIWRSVLTSER